MNCKMGILCVMFGLLLTSYVHVNNNRAENERLRLQVYQPANAEIEKKLEELGVDADSLETKYVIYTNEKEFTFLGVVGAFDESKVDSNRIKVVSDLENKVEMKKDGSVHLALTSEDFDKMEEDGVKVYVDDVFNASVNLLEHSKYDKVISLVKTDVNVNKVAGIEFSTRLIEGKDNSLRTEFIIEGPVEQLSKLTYEKVRGIDFEKKGNQMIISTETWDRVFHGLEFEINYDGIPLA